MGRLIREKNWENSSIGPPEKWPHSLRTLLNLVVNSRFPMFLFWGDDLLCFYNDAYRPSLGQEGKHPNILGMPAAEAWGEIWDVIKPLLDQVMTTGEPTWSEDQLIPFYRNGKIEDIYWTFSYSPAIGDDGKIEGVFTTCTETTDKVLYLERLRENEEQFRLAMEAAEMGNWDWNPTTGEYFVNPRIAQWIGRSAQGQVKLADHDAFEPIAPEDRLRVQKAIESAMDPKGNGKYDCTYTLRVKEQPDRIVRVLGRAWFDEHGVVQRFNGVMQDVTRTHHENEERLKLVSLIETSNEFIGLANADAEVEYLNMAGLRTLGWNGVEGHSIMDAIYPEDRELAARLIKEMGDRDALSHEIRFINTQNGEPIWMKWNILVFRDPENNKKIGFGTVSTNIEIQRKRESDLKNALDQVRVQEKRFRNLVKQAPVGIAIFEGEEYLVRLANDTALHIVDKEEEEVMGVPFFDILPDTREVLQPLMTEVLLTGNPNEGTNFPITLECGGRKQTGYFNFIFYPFREGDGPVKGVIVVAVEVTESVILSNKLKESAKQFRNLVIQSPIPMCILRGEDFVIEMANDILIEKIWRVNKEEVLGMPLLEVFPDLEEKKYPQLLNRVLLDGESLTVNESFAKIQGSDGIREFYLDYDYAPLKELDGTVSGIMITVNDVTDKVHARMKLEAFSRDLEQQVSERTDLLKSANLQLQDSIKELEQTNEELQSFAYISSHDLQEPLRKIQMFTSRILERNKGELKDKDAYDFQRITVAASRMRTLIDDLLAFSKTTTSSTDFKKVDLNEVLEEIKGEFSDEIDSLDAIINAENLATVQGIPFQLHQLFQNLMENSLKFAKDGVKPVITIECRKVTWKETRKKVLLEPGKKYYEITFADNGIGFKPQFEDRIFQVFQRLHPRDEVEGTGIGLAIVKKIIHNHGGSIIASSEPGEGAVFTMYIPIT